LPLDAREILKLQRIISLAEKLINESPKPKRGRPALYGAVVPKSKNGKRVRRTGKALVRFRKMLKAERERGVPVARIARKHRISPAYIYLLV